MAGDEALRTAIDARWSAPLLSGGPDHPPSVRTTARGVFVGTAMFDSTGAPAATLWAVIDPGPVRQQAHDAATSMVLKALPLIFGTLFLTWWALVRWSSRVMESVQRTCDARKTTRYGHPLWIALLLSGIAAPCGMVMAVIHPCATSNPDAMAMPAATPRARVSDGTEAAAGVWACVLTRWRQGLRGSFQRSSKKPAHRSGRASASTP